MSNGNEPAFPTERVMSNDGETVIADGALGLTKREYIAIEAMKGILANPQVIEGIGDVERKYEDVIKHSFRHADAILKED